MKTKKTAITLALIIFIDLQSFAQFVDQKDAAVVAENL